MPVARPNTLGLTRVELDGLMDRMDQTGSGSKSTPRRGSRRLTYRRSGVPMILAPKGLPCAAIAVATRNISRGGMSFLHSAYVHLETHVIAVLEHRSRGQVKVPGRVTRCRHVERHVHEVGVQFNEPIDVREFLPMDHTGAQFSLEIANPGVLSGALLVAADYSIDRALLCRHLDGTNLSISEADSFEAALTRAKESKFDLIISDYDLGKGTGLDLLRVLRESGRSAPVIIMSADSSTLTRQLAREAHADAFLPKPVSREMLLSAVAEFLLLGGGAGSGGGAINCTLPSDSPLLTLARTFIDDIDVVLPQLQRSIEEGKASEFLKHATRLCSTADSLGFAPLARAAEKAIQSVNASQSLSESRGVAEAMVEAFKRARIGRAA